MPPCTLPVGMIPGTLLFVYIGSTAASITEAVAGNTTQTPLQQVSSGLLHTCMRPSSRACSQKNYFVFSLPQDKLVFVEPVLVFPALQLCAAGVNVDAHVRALHGLSTFLKGNTHPHSFWSSTPAPPTPPTDTHLHRHSFGPVFLDHFFFQALFWTGLGLTILLTIAGTKMSSCIAPIQFACSRPHFLAPFPCVCDAAGVSLHNLRVHVVASDVVLQDNTRQFVGHEHCAFVVVASDVVLQPTVPSHLTLPLYPSRSLWSLTCSSSVQSPTWLGES
jgi:hypothetical protein